MRIKKFIFGSIAFFISFVLVLGLFLIIDMYYHKKYLQLAGLNHRGYRGEVIGSKQENEIRLVMVGGSVVLGYGVKYYEALPAQLEKKLQAYCDALGCNKKMTVINLAYNNEGAYAFYYNLNDFRYLDYDYVVFFSGYNDLGVGNTTLFRHSNPIFRIFGYMPILPTITKEKIMVIKSGGQLEKAYWGEKIAFKPNRKDKIKIAVLDNVLKVYNKMENVIGRLKKIKKLDFDVEKLEEDKWSWYKYFMKKAIDFALEHKKKVIVITPPYINQNHIEEQNSLKNVLLEEYKGNKNFLYENLGESISLKNEKLAYDGMHLTSKGCQIMADIITKIIGTYIFEGKDDL